MTKLRSQWLTFALACREALGLRLSRGRLLRTLPILIVFLLASHFSNAQTTSDTWPQTEAKLNNLLSGSSEQKRTALAEIRSIHTEQASRLALPALSDPDEIVRATAAAAVVFLPEQEAAQALLPLLDDKAPFVRREAAYALGTVGNWSATNRLRRVLNNDPDPEVRSAAAIAIGNIGDYSALDDLIAILKQRPIEKNGFIRRSAARAIGQIFELYATGKASGVVPESFLPPKFKEAGGGRDMQPLYRQIDINSIAAVLAKAVRDPKESVDTRREAAFALGSTRLPSTAAVLRSQLTSPDPYLVEIAKEALLKTQNPR